MKISRKAVITLISCALIIPTGIQTVAGTTAEPSSISAGGSNSEIITNILSTKYDSNSNTVTIVSTDSTYNANSRCEYYEETAPELIHLEDLGRVKIEQNGKYCFTIYSEDGSSSVTTTVTVTEIQDLGNKPEIKLTEVEYTTSKTSAKITVKAECKDKIIGYSIDGGLTWQLCNYFIVNQNNTYNIMVKSSKNAKSDSCAVKITDIKNSLTGMGSDSSITDSIKITGIKAIDNAGIKSSYIVGETIEDPGKISVAYSDGSTEEVFITSVMISYDFSKKGNTEVKITYAGREISIPTSVIGTSSDGGGFWPSYWEEITESPSPSPVIPSVNPTEVPVVIKEPTASPNTDINDLLIDGRIDEDISKIPSSDPDQNIIYGENFSKGIRENADGNSSATFTGDVDYLPFVLPAGKVDVGKITANESVIVTIPEGITSVDITSSQSRVTGDLLGIKLIPKTLGYSDVLPTEWYYSSIMQASSIGFLKGTSNTKYSPESKLSTKDTITALNRVITKNEDFYMATSRAEIESKLNNLQKDEVYYDRANILAKMRGAEIQETLAMIAATEAKSITREQLAELLANIFDDVLSATGNTKTFSDTQSQAVAYCVKAGLLQGKSDSKFDPKANLTRAELATVLIRLNDLYIQDSISLLQ